MPFIKLLNKNEKIEINFSYYYKNKNDQGHTSRGKVYCRTN